MKRWKGLRSLVVGGRRPLSTPAAERLVETHYATVYNLAYRTLGRSQDAEDIAQQTFLRALPRLDELDSQDQAGWLCRVAANLCIDELRRSKRRYSADQLADEMWNEVASPVPFGSPEATIEQREVRLAVWRATLALPPQQRLALALREWHGMSYQQIASTLATSVSAVETLLFRARQGFRRAYEQRLTQPSADDAGCAWCLERLSASVDGELSAAEQRRVDAHVERCPTCRFAADQLGTTSKLYALVPLFVPALPAKAALLTAISGIGAAGAGAVLKVAGAGAADAAASHASGGLSDVARAVTVGAGTAAVAGAASGSAGAIGAGSAAGLGSAATVAGSAAGLGSAATVAGSAAGLSSAATVAGSAAGLGSAATLAGAAGAVGATKSGVAVVAVAVAIGAAVWSGGQPEAPAPLANEPALVSQAPAGLVSIDARPVVTSHDSWTPPSTVSIEGDATEADADQPANAEAAPASPVTPIAQPSPVTPIAQPPLVASEPAEPAEPELSLRQARGEDSPAEDNEVSAQARDQTDDRSGDDVSEESDPRDAPRPAPAQIQPRRGDDELRPRLAAPLAPVPEAPAPSAADDEGQVTEEDHAPKLAAAPLSTPMHQAGRSQPREEGDGADQPLPAAPPLTRVEQQAEPIRPTVSRVPPPSRLDDHEVRQGSDERHHAERELPESGD